MEIRVRLGPAPNKQVAFSLLSPPCLVAIINVDCPLCVCCLDLSLASSTPSRTCTTPTPPTRFLDAAETCTAAANSASTSPRPKSFQSCPALAATGATALQHHLTRPPTRFVCRRLVSTADESDEGDTPAANLLRQMGRSWCHPVHARAHPPLPHSWRPSSTTTLLSPTTSRVGFHEPSSPPTSSSWCRPPDLTRCNHARPRRGTA